MEIRTGIIMGSPDVWSRYLSLNRLKAKSFDYITSSIVLSWVRSDGGDCCSGFSIWIPRLNNSTDTYGSLTNSC